MKTQTIKPNKDCKYCHGSGEVFDTVPYGSTTAMFPSFCECVEEKADEDTDEIKLDLSVLCDNDCNKCPLVTHPNSRMLTKVLNELHDALGNDVYNIVQRHCPAMTVCYDCRIDDFVHCEGCKIVAG